MDWGEEAHPIGGIFILTRSSLDCYFSVCDKNKPISLEPVVKTWLSF